jgi:hypothetical protein
MIGRRLWIVAVLVVACAARQIHAVALAAQMNQPFTVKIGDVATVAGQGLDVTFEALVADSRCPRGAQCIRAGEAVIRITIRKASETPQAFELRTTAGSDAVEQAGYRVQLVSVMPYP